MEWRRCERIARSLPRVVRVSLRVGFISRRDFGRGGRRLRLHREDGRCRERRLLQIESHVPSLPLPLSQGKEFYNALKRQGCTTKMVIYPRTPHGIEEPRLLVDCMERNLEWFDRYVGNAKNE